ncbi:hypothetical protein L596_009542 [Steinernema carpocapsae]|nr:hypothetical protein L596_009542 [Steinernema carpocapsae]
MRRLLTVANRSARLLVCTTPRRPLPTIFIAQNRCFLSPSSSLLAKKRIQKNQQKTPIAQIQNEEEEDDDEEIDDGLPKDYKEKMLKTPSRRLDSLLNRATGDSNSQVEKHILQGKVRVNDEAVTKKSYNIQKHDEIDVWKATYEDNADLATVNRIEVVDYKVTEAGYEVRVKLWKNMLVENWRGGS